MLHCETQPDLDCETQLEQITNVCGNLESQCNLVVVTNHSKKSFPLNMELLRKIFSIREVKCKRYVIHFEMCSIKFFLNLTCGQKRQKYDYKYNCLFEVTNIMGKRCAPPPPKAMDSFKFEFLEFPLIFFFGFVPLENVYRQIFIPCKHVAINIQTSSMMVGY